MALMAAAAAAISAVFVNWARAPSHSASSARRVAWAACGADAGSSSRRLLITRGSCSPARERAAWVRSEISCDRRRAYAAASRTVRIATRAAAPARAAASARACCWGVPERSQGTEPIGPPSATPRASPHSTTRTVAGMASRAATWLRIDRARGGPWAAELGLGLEMPIWRLLRYSGTRATRLVELHIHCLRLPWMSWRAMPDCYLPVVATLPLAPLSPSAIAAGPPGAALASACGASRYLSQARLYCRLRPAVRRADGPHCYRNVITGCLACLWVIMP